MTMKTKKNAAKPSEKKDTEIKSSKRKASERNEAEPKAKKEKIVATRTVKARVKEDKKILPMPQRPTVSGLVLSMGQGDTGQLGLGEDLMESSRPRKVLLPTENIVQICAGGMHSVCLSEEGEVFSWGCNDEASLGRPTPQENLCFTPAKVEGFSTKVTQVCAGDSHTVTLDDGGQVYVWGTFRNHSGVIGMPEADVDRKAGRLGNMGGGGGVCQQVKLPMMILAGKKVVQIASGYSHVVCLTQEGEVYSFGAGDFGQLGRILRSGCEGGRKKEFGKLLVPGRVVVGKVHGRVVAVWAGGYTSYALTQDSEVYCWGLNNYYQLGFQDMDIRYFPEKSPAFEPLLLSTSHPPSHISISEHHVLTLTDDGRVMVMGRGTYGRLGLGEGDQDAKELTVVKGLEGKRVVGVACGLAVSFAVDDAGEVYSWGMGSNNQLGHGDDDDDVHIPATFAPKQMKALKGIMVSAGAQHTLILVQRRKEEGKGGEKEIKVKEGKDGEKKDEKMEDDGEKKEDGNEK